MKKRTTVLLAMLVLLPVMSYARGKAEGKAEGQNDIFKDDPNGLLTVRNETNADMVLFAGNVARNNVLGGIRAKSSRVFDISKIENVPDEGAFILNAVSATVYQNKKNVSGSDILYSGFVNYDKKDSLKKQITIPDAVDVTASTFIMVSNNNPVVCKIRLNSPIGETIAALRPFEENRKIWIKPLEYGMPYTIYLFFVVYDEKEPILELMPTTQGITVTPKSSEYSIVNFTADTSKIMEMRINLLFE